MRKLWGYALQWKHEGGFHPATHIFVALLLGILIYINYTIDFENRYLNAYVGSGQGYLQFFLFYALVYFLTVAGQGMLLGSRTWMQPQVWGKAAIFLLVLAINAGSTFQYRWVYEVSWLEGPLQRWVLYLSLNVGSFLIFFVPLVLIWWVADRRRQEGLYGLQRKGFVAAPYLLLLTGMVPLILLAATQPDFQASYPTWQAAESITDQTGWSKWWFTVAYQLAYGLDFLTVELLFRGALVVGMSRLLGKESVLPMVAVYCILHFGKPLGEAISSIFGGYILGVIALYGRNIWGGVLIHVGVALLMEWAAILFG